MRDTDGMEFHEKLQRRVRELGLNKSKASRDAGLPDSTISAYLAKSDSLPRIDIAAKIARAIQVPLEWLADDSADWPPFPLGQTNSAQLLSDFDLLFELAIRCRREAVTLLNAVDKAQKEDWFLVQKIAESWSSERPIPKAIWDVAEVISDIETAFVRWSVLSSPLKVGQKHHREMPGSNRDKDDFDGMKLLERVASVKILPGYRAARQIIYRDPLPASLADFGDTATTIEVIERFKALSIQDRARDDYRLKPVTDTKSATPAPRDAEVPAASKPVRKPSKPPSKL